jgi:hypothetical protein
MSSVNVWCSPVKARSKQIGPGSTRTTTDGTKRRGLPLSREGSLLLGVFVLGTVLTAWAIYAYAGFTDPLLSAPGGIALLIAAMYGLGLTSVADEILETPAARER